MSPLYTAKRCSKNYECDYESEKNCADFSLKMHQKCLVTWLRPDMLGELLRLLKSPLLDLTSRDSKKGREKERDRRERTWGKK